MTITVRKWDLSCTNIGARIKWEKCKNNWQIDFQEDSMTDVRRYLLIVIGDQCNGHIKIIFTYNPLKTELLAGSQTWTESALKVGQQFLLS